MPTSDRLLSSRPDAPWLPAGGRADVVLAADRAEPPAPVGLVRLLVTRGDTFLAVPRGKGGPLDLPTRPVGTDGETCLRALIADTLADDVRPRLLGWVHNHVQRADDGNDWPVPDAYFVVWHCEVPDALGPEGTWLDLRGMALRERHWWPLAEALRPRAGN